MKLIVGLGNPGSEYEGTRHNIGAELLRSFAEELNIPLRHKTCQSAWGRGEFKGGSLILACPSTYMNHSGFAVADLSGYFKISPEDILVALDDIHLGVGQLRLRPHGSAGGHNGLKSVLEQLHAQNVQRLRIGVGSPQPDAPHELREFVLARFHPEEKKILEGTLKKAREALGCWLESGAEIAMSRYNG